MLGHHISSTLIHEDPNKGEHYDRFYTPGPGWPGENGGCGG